MPMEELCFSGLSQVRLFTVLEDEKKTEAAIVTVIIEDHDPVALTNTLIGQDARVFDPWSPTGDWDEKDSHARKGMA